MMAKVNEVMKANGKRELSMDELDQVSGGSYAMHADGTISVNGGEPMTRAEFNNMIFAMAKQFGLNITIGYLRDGVGYDCTEMHNVSSIEAILDRFWRNIDGSNH